MPADLAALVRSVVAEHGPMALDDLVTAVAAAGADLGPEPLAVLAPVLLGDELVGVAPLADGRYVWLPALLDGRVFTHTLRPEELEYGFLAVEPDLLPLWGLTDLEPYDRLADGSPLHFVDPATDAEALEDAGIPPEALPDTGAFVLAAGALDGLGFAPGELVALTVTPGGLRLDRAEATATPDRLAERLGAVLTGAEEPDQPLPLDVAVWSACMADDGLFRLPLDPLDDLVAAAGLDRDGDTIARAGVDIDAWRAEQLAEDLAERHELDPDDAVALLALLGLHAQFETLVVEAEAAGGGDVAIVEGFRLRAAGEPARPSSGDDGELSDHELLTLALTALGDPPVAEAFLEETLGDSSSAAALGLLAETLEPQAPTAAVAALRWLQAKAHERMGFALDAERDLERALAADPAWPPILVDLARCASDRGDATRALSLLRRAGAEPGHPLVTVLEHFRPKPRNLGRNERCWCGSGRKHKQCHLGREELPIEERAPWLFVKAGHYAQDGLWEAQLLDAAGALENVPLEQAVYDPLVIDTVLVEGGAFEAFLADRGVLLPADEQSLAEAWLEIDRSLYEVAAPGTPLTVVDLRSGAEVVVTGRLAALAAEPGDLLCCRAVPAGSETLFIGAVRRVAAAHRDEALALLAKDPEPADLVVALTRWSPA